MVESEISEIEVMIQRYKSSLPKLNIFLLGPSEHNVDEYAKKCYRKRCEIKEVFDNGHDKVFFPETVYETAKVGGIDVTNITAFEVCLLDEEADIILMIFILNASGVLAELTVFSHHPEFANKMCIFYDSSYYSRGNHKHWHINDALDLIEGNHGMTKPFFEIDLDSGSLLGNVEEIIERKRRVYSMMPYKKYKGVV